MNNVTDEQLRTALLNAHKAGDRESATRLASELQKRTDSINQQLSGEDGGGFSFLNKGISHFAGSGVDVINWGMKQAGLPVSESPFGGSKSIRSGMRSVGIPAPEREAITPLESIAEVAGETVVASFPVMGALGRLSKMKGTTGALANTMRNDIINRPLRALSAETGGVVGAGAARHVAKEREFSPGTATSAEMYGGLIGGAAMALSPINIARAAGEKIASWIRAPFTAGGAFERASKRVQSLVTDPIVAAQHIDDLSGTKLLPSARTDEPGLMALEKAVLDRDPAEATRISINAQKATDELVKTIKHSGNAKNTREFLLAKRRRLDRAIDARIEKASDDARNAMDTVAFDGDASQTSLIMKGALEEALADAKVQESMLWQAVPQDAPVPLSPVYKRMKELEASLSSAQSDNMPQKAREAIALWGKGEDPSHTTVREVDGLYKELGQFARIARANGQGNQARLAEDIRETLMSAMGNAKGGKDVKDAVASARAFSRTLNEKFNRGAVGRILGTSRRGGSVIEPEVAMRSTVGRPREAGAVAARQISEANPNTLSAMQDFLKVRFRESVIADGAVDPGKAASFMKQHKELLDAFPILRDQFSSAKSSADVLRTVKNRSEALRRTYDRPEVSATARYLRAPLDGEINAMMRTPNPSETMGRLVSSLDGDVAAINGVKAGISDYIVRKISGGAFNPITEQRVISGLAMQELLNDKSFIAVASKAYSPVEIKRLKETAKVLAKFEKQQLNKFKESGISTDAPSRLLNIITGVIGAKLGAKMSSSSGASIQAASIGASEARRILRGLTADKAEQILIDAVEDPDLMKALLLNPVGASRRDLARRDRALRVWAIGVGSRLDTSGDKEEPQ